MLVLARRDARQRRWMGTGRSIGTRTISATRVGLAGILLAALSLGGCGRASDGTPSDVPQAGVDPTVSEIGRGRLSPQAGERTLRNRAANAYARLPLSFEPNAGRFGPQVDFVSRGPGYTLSLQAGEAVLGLSAGSGGGSSPQGGLLPNGRDVVRMRLAGARDVDGAGHRRMPGRVSSFLGTDPRRWRTGIPTYERVAYDEIYPGIGIAYYGNQRRLEYDFEVAPGADPSRIRLRFDGARAMRLGPNGDLLLSTGAGELIQQAPVAYQEVNGIRRPVASRFVMGSDGDVRIDVGRYDRGRHLTIDPVLLYSTYLGGTNTDLGDDIFVDSSGSAYVTGRTQSTNFPTTTGVFDTSFNSGADVFVTKLAPNGASLVYSTYIGGSGDDFGQGVAVDSSGNAHITGRTTSSNYPTTAGLDTTLGGSSDAFVTKLNSTATSPLTYSTYLGGTGDEQGEDIEVDSSGRAYVTGRSNSSGGSLPTTVGAADTSNNGGHDAFVTRYTTTGTI